jgi:hemerythrin-like domain-containing protein
MSELDKRRPVNMDRRGFLKSASAGGAAFLGAGALAWGRPGPAPGSRTGSEPGVMSPNEDLMQEHALLSRVLLIYEEAVRRLEGQKALDPDLLMKSARVIRDFIEEYHEKDEETYVFPRFQKAGQQTDLVALLLEQHKAGRGVTEAILASSNGRVFADPAGRKRLIAAIRSFIRMYRPHAAREGSFLFPAFRNLLSPAEFDDLGAMFEKKEHEILGPEGFEGQVQVVAGLERQLGIYDLAQFTPR